MTRIPEWLKTDHPREVIVPPPISWTDKTHHTQPDGRKASRTVEVFAVAWDQQHLDRTQRDLQAWTTRDPVAANSEAAVLRQTIADADWDTVERHCDLDAVVDRFDQLEQESPASNGRGMIDDFRLRGHARGVIWVARLQRGGGARRWCTNLTTTNLHYQRAQPSPLWSRLCPGIRIGRELARIPRILCGKA